MKVVCLLGSPRANGNSDRMARRLCDAFVRAGASVGTHPLRSLSYEGCRNLFHCKTGGARCGLDDDLTPILAEIEAADILVLASPVYFTELTSDLRAAIERFFSFFVPGYPTATEKSRLAPGKRVVVIQTQGEPDTAYGDLIDRYVKAFGLLGFAGVERIWASGVREPDAVEAVPAVWAEVERVAGGLIRGYTAPASA